MKLDVDLHVRLGEFELRVAFAHAFERPLAIVGPNGSGKTTLLRTMAGAHRPLAGHVRVGESTWFDASANVDLPPEDRRVGYVPQSSGLFAHLSVLDNVGFSWLARAPRPDRAARREAARAMLDSIGAVDLIARPTASLSGGERQRVALARALLGEPTMVLLDEPLAALDVASRRSLRASLPKRLDGRPTVVVSHDLRDLIALDARVVALEAGRVVQIGSLESLRTEPATDFVAELCEPLR